jgi:hypothetical protein
MPQLGPETQLALVFRAKTSSPEAVPIALIALMAWVLWWW